GDDVGSVIIAAVKQAANIRVFCVVLVAVLEPEERFRDIKREKLREAFARFLQNEVSVRAGNQSVMVRHLGEVVIFNLLPRKPEIEPVAAGFRMKDLEDH